MHQGKIDKQQNKQKPPSQKENGGREFAIIRCYFLTLAIIFYSQIRLKYEAQQSLLSLTI